jgi:hypothetical protein
VLNNVSNLHFTKIMMGRVIVMQEDAGFKVRNWPEYNESIVKRGEMYLTFPFFGVRDKDLDINRGMIEPSRTKKNLSK